MVKTNSQGEKKKKLQFFKLNEMFNNFNVVIVCCLNETSLPNMYFIKVKVIETVGLMD